MKIGYFFNRNGLKIAYRIWKLKNNERKPINIVLLVHGMLTYSKPYIATADVLVDDETIVLGLDLQGHGDSESFIKRGDYKRFLDFVENIEDSIKFIKKEFPDINLYISGDSMGALVVTHYLCRNYLQNPIIPIQKAILWAPAFKANYENGWARDLKFNLQIGWNLIFNPEGLTIRADHSRTFRNKEALEYHNQDPKIIKFYSPRYLLNISRAMDRLWDSKAYDKIITPYIILHGTNDMLISQKASLEFYQKSRIRNKCKYIEIKNCWHNIYSDPAFNDDIIKEIKDYIKS